MPNPVRITAEHEAVEVDLWGATFYTQRVTRSRQKEIDRIAQEAAKLEDDDIDGSVRMHAEMLDQLLEPAEGKRKKASAHIVAKWEADELTFSELLAFLERLAEAARPT